MPSDFSPRVAKNTIAGLMAENRRLESDWNRERDGRLEAEAAIARVRELALMGGQDPADIRRQIIAVVGVTRYECGVCGGGVRCSCSADGTDGGA